MGVEGEEKIKLEERKSFFGDYLLFYFKREEGLRGFLSFRFVFCDFCFGLGKEVLGFFVI